MLETIALVVGLVILTAVILALFGLVGLGAMVILGMIGAIAFGYGVIEGLFGGIDEFADEIGLEIATETLHMLAIVGL